MRPHPNLHEVEEQTARELEALRTELAGSAPAEQVDAVGRRHFRRLMAQATITDFVPVLVCRATKEDLVWRARTHDRAGQAETLLAAG